MRTDARAVSVSVSVSVATAVVAALLAAQVAVVGAVTRDQFYPHGAPPDGRLPPGAEVSSPELPLKVPIVFFGETYETIFVSNYGVLSFRADIPSFLNAEFPLPYPSIAAFYANVDTSASGGVYFRETDDAFALAKAEESVQSNFHEYYDFKPAAVFVATWLDVTYSGNRRPDRRNSFQIAVISNGTESFVEFLYPEREIQWIQRETPPGSLPDAKAQAGFVAEDGRMFTLRGSGSHQIRNIVSWSNTQEPGKYVFRVGNVPRDGTVAVPDQYDQNEVELEEESKTCAQSGPSVCHLQAKCVDYQAGICCECNEGYFGNGKTCIKDDVPLRVHGKLNGVVNNVNLNDVDIQAYVVVADGRSYTALSQVPPSLGSSLQLLNVLGGVIGWMFAKSSGAAKNGYQLTGGVFNHSADIFFPASGDRVIINQEYVGHDVFDQIALDADIRGTVPDVNPGSRLEVSEYEEQYSAVEPGVVHSASSRTFTNKITGQKYEQVIAQSFVFNTCKFAPPSEEDVKPYTLKAMKNFLGYESRDNIVRYGTSNRVRSTGQEDPCVQGRNSCGPHSACVVQGDSFTCVCRSGFTSIYYQGATACVDIDECAAGTHNCDSNADCYNRDGGFQCRCREGYEGSGTGCTRVSRCRDEVCDSNAQCVDNPGEEPICLCNAGFTGDGQRCWQTYDSACADCSPFASCALSETGGHRCACNPGYVGDGAYCTESASTVPDASETSEASVAPLQSTTPYAPEETYNEDFFLPNCNITGCFCPDGYSMFKHGDNDLCRIDSYPDEKEDERKDNSIVCNSDADCPPNAICSFPPEAYLSNERDAGQCACPEGYEGDAYECIERSGPSCSCGPSAHCVDAAAGERICVCDLGYHGDGYVCRPNFSCFNDSDCEYNAECRAAASGERACQCLDGFTKDHNDACVPDAQLCDGAACAEHASCLFDDALGVNYCHCDDGYEGEGILQCAPLGSACDAADCGADAACVPDEGSFRCACREGFAGDGYSCAPEANCRSDIYLCDAHASCVPTSDGFECQCNAGYGGNGSHCALDPRAAGGFLVASDGASVYRAPLAVTPRAFATPLHSAAYQIAVGVDVDCLAGRVYWGDVGAGAVKRASYDGSGFEQFLAYDVQSPEGLAIDWDARNIFWTDSKKLTIEVANMDTKVRKVLFKRDGISNPRGIAVHPGKGKIFWSDWNRAGPKIEWANMDGSQRGVFLDSTKVKLPNSLAIDWSRDRLCYSDAGLWAIECVGIDTLERETVAANCSYPFGLAISGEKYYWTDWKTLKIEYVDNLTQLRGQVPVATASRRLYGVAAAPEACPEPRHACSRRAGGCAPDQLCLPDGRGGRSCLAGDQPPN